MFIHLDSHFAMYFSHLFNYVLFHLFNYLVCWKLLYPEISRKRKKTKSLLRKKITHKDGDDFLTITSFICQNYFSGWFSLANCLEKFFATARRNDGKIHNKKSLTSTQAAIDQYLQSPSLSKRFSILGDSQFSEANRALLNFMKYKIWERRVTFLPQNQ